jgi:SHS2 domain-containing protein
VIPKRWEHFPHQADIGGRGMGPTREDAFEQVALALTAVVCDLSAVQALQAFELTCAAPDDDQLLFEWLNRLIFEMATRRMLFSRFDLFVGGKRMKARVWGEPVEAGR